MQNKLLPITPCQILYKEFMQTMNIRSFILCVFVVTTLLRICYAQKNEYDFKMRDKNLTMVNDLIAQKIYIVDINGSNLPIFLNLSQAYEAEFSSLTGKLPNEDGVFNLDTLPAPPYIGYIAYKENVPIGFCILNVNSKPQDIAEFYIIPVLRGKHFGQTFAHFIFKKYPGLWQVRQIAGANAAVAFWRKVISRYTNGYYKEETINDPDWGIVTRQTFVSTLTENTVFQQSV